MKGRKGKRLKRRNRVENCRSHVQSYMMNPQPLPRPPTSPVRGEAESSGGASVPNLLQPTQKKKRRRSSRVFHGIRSAFHSFPILNPTCRFPSMVPRGSRPQDGHIHGAMRMTGTLYGPRKSRINLAIQEGPSSLPVLVLELGVPTGKLLQEIGSGLARIALECEKKTTSKTKLLDEAMWTMYCNGRKTGYGTKRDPSEADLNVMQLLHTVSMGAGVLPAAESQEPADGELTYMRANFDRVVGSKDSETFYMLNPDSHSGPDLSIFFIRI